MKANIELIRLAASIVAYIAIVGIVFYFCCKTAKRVDPNDETFKN